MFFRKSHLIFPLCLLLVLFMSCGTSKKATHADTELPFGTMFLSNNGNAKKKSKKKAVPPQRKQLTSAERHMFNVLFHEALLCSENNEIDAHRVLLERALEIDSTASEVLCRLARVKYAYAKREDSLLRKEALHHIERAAHYAPEDLDILEDYAIMLHHEGYAEKALRCYERMASLNPTTSVLLSLAQSYTEQQHYAEALNVYNYMERQSGRNKAIIRGKLMVYTHTNDSVRLISFVDSLIADNPNVYEYQLLKGNFYEQLFNRPDTARAIYQDVLRQSPHNSEAQYALLDHYAQQEDDENFFRQLQVFVKNKHVEEKVRAEVLKMYTSHCVQKQEASLPKLRAFLDTLEHPENATGEILVVHTALLWQMNAAPDSLMNLINRTLRFQPENTSIRLHGVSLCFNNDQDDEVIRLCDEGQFYDPQEIRFYYFSAAYKLQQGRVDETLEMLERGESYFMESEDKELASEIYGMMGDLYHERADLERAFAAYDNALTCNPDNASALNNYAYFLSLDERDLQKAMTMAHRACELTPDEATYLDTYAWVLYQLGQYTQAKIYIDQALAAVPEGEESDTYYKHAGDIYWKLGDRKSARKFWKRAEDIQKQQKYQE